MNHGNGKDISFYDENNFGGYKSYHVFGRYTDFFGAYWHHEDFGVGRYALTTKKAGQEDLDLGPFPAGNDMGELLSDTTVSMWRFNQAGCLSIRRGKYIHTLQNTAGLLLPPLIPGPNTGFR